VTARPDYLALARRKPPVPRALDDLFMHIQLHPSPVIWLLPHEFLVCAREATRTMYGRHFDYNRELLRCGHKTVRLARWPQ
jgi:hypothetical protein